MKIGAPLSHAIFRLPRLRKKGTPHKHIIARAVDSRYEYFLHATKGWRREART